MALLTEEDYSDLERMQLKFKEDEVRRLLVFLNFKLKTGLYQVDHCNVLVVIPENYPMAGNDMLWTYPRLQRTDSRPILGTLDPGSSNYLIHMQNYDEKIYDRWSRHWQVGNQVWKAGRDNITTIVNRLNYVLANSHEA